MAKGKRTYQPNTRRRAKTHGFRLRMRTRAGRADDSPRGDARAAAACPSPAERYVRTPANQRVFRDGRPVHGKRVVLFVAPGSGRSALVAGKRVGGAVQRNRARRVLRAALHEVAPRGVEGHDVVLVARETIRDARTQDLIEEMTELLERGEIRP